MHLHGPMGFSKRGKRGGMIEKGKDPWHRNAVMIFLMFYIYIINFFGGM